MFTHRLTNKNQIFRVTWSEYSDKHFRKSFAKEYKGKIWTVTEMSILADLSRIAQNLQETNQIDELRSDGRRWLFKYDFRIAKSKNSAKSSGNRCLCFLDLSSAEIKILLIYKKTDCPKNQGETQWLKSVYSDQFPDFASKLQWK